MTSFIECGGRYRNLSEISTFSRRKDEAGQWRWFARHTDGSDLGAMSWGFDPEESFATIIPAGYPLHAAIVQCLSPENDEKPSLADVWTEMHLVAAWRISFGTASPVFFETPSSDAVVALPMGGDGEQLFTIPCDRSGVSLEQIQRMVLREAQADWDKKHPEATT